MNILNVFKNRSYEALPQPVTEPTAPLRKIVLTYDINDDRFVNIGFHQAIETRANPETYQLLLNHLLRNVEAETHDLRNLNARRKAELEQETDGIIAEKERMTASVLPPLKEKLLTQKMLHETVQRDPAQMPTVAATFDATKEKIMLTGLIFLTMFLYWFYFLTGHAAFMKNIGRNLENAQGSDVSALFETVFDTSSVVSDLMAAPLNILLCAFFPFVFIVTGYLVHHFLDKKQFGTMAGAIAVTMGLDLAIAYKVTSKMFDARRLAGLEEQDWRFSMVFGDVNFYLILLAGMAVYILWGVLLGLYLGEKSRGDRVTGFLEGCRREIARLEEEIREIGEKVAGLESSLRENRGKLARLDEPGTIAFFSWQQIEQILDSFTAGWSRGIQKYFQDEQAQLEREKSLRSGELLTLLSGYKSALKAEMKGE